MHLVLLAGCAWYLARLARGPDVVWDRKGNVRCSAQLVRLRHSLPSCLPRLLAA